MYWESKEPNEMALSANYDIWQYCFSFFSSPSGVRRGGRKGATVLTPYISCRPVGSSVHPRTLQTCAHSHSPNLKTFRRSRATGEARWEVSTLEMKGSSACGCTTSSFFESRKMRVAAVSIYLDGTLDCKAFCTRS